MTKEFWIKILKAIIKILDYIFEEIVEIGGVTEIETSDDEYFLFPMENLRVTQGENTGTHLASLAIDFGGKDTGKDCLYAPCTLIVKRIRENRNGEVYFESEKPVIFADGTKDYARLLMLHDETTQEMLEVGQVINQGEYFYMEGGMGQGKPGYFANHVHIEAGKGKWSENGAEKHYRTGYKDHEGNTTFSIKNPCSLYNLFLLKRDTIILEDGGYNWKYVK